MTTYDIGDRRKLICEVRDESQILADPEDLTFKLLEPDQTITVYVFGTDSELAKDSTGVYHVYWDCAKAGIHYWRYEATGSIVAAEETHFFVQESPIITAEAAAGG